MKRLFQKKIEKYEKMEGFLKYMSDLYVVATPFHLLYACNMSKNNDFLIVIDEFLLSEPIKKMIYEKFGIKWHLLHDFYYYRENVIALGTFRMNMKRAKALLNDQQICNIYSFNDVDPVSQWLQANINHFGKVYIVEEGIGLYRDTKKRHEILFKCVGKILFGYTFQNVKRIGESKYTDVIICQEREKLSDLQKTKEVSPMYPIDFSALASEVGIQRYYCRNWFIGQPLVEDGVITNEEYIGFLRTLICNDLLDSELMIKPHPREKIEKYRALQKMYAVKICSIKEIPVELLIDNSRQTIVYTLYSSAVRNFSNVKNVEVRVMFKKVPKITNISESLFEGKGICVVGNDV